MSLSIIDAHKLLELPAEYDLQELKRVYRKMMLKYHPDINPEGTEISKKINEAYDILLKQLEAGKQPRKNRRTPNSFTRTTGTTFTEAFYKKHARLSRTEVYGMISFLIRSGKAKEMSDIWITADFRVYLITDLATSHLANIKNYLEISGDTSSDVYTKICALLNARSAEVGTDKTTKKTKIKLHF